MTSSILNTLSATLKESNYRNQIYSSENGYKLPDSQSFDYNDERSDPKYGDLFYEDYKKKNDEKDEIREIVLNLKKMKICPKKKVLMKTLRIKATMILI